MLIALATSAQAASQAVSKTDETNWVRYTVPLPKQISIPAKVAAKSGSIAIVEPANPNYLTKQAVKELTELVGESSDPATFTIKMTLGGTDAEPLNALRNGGQAYSIRPIGEDQLELIAPQPRGLYYAAKTLQQLIKGSKKGNKFDMPLVTITDWPDMDERGLWGSDTYDHLRWMGDRKMNLVEQIMAQGVDFNGASYAYAGGYRMALFTEGPLYGLNPVPVSLHLEQVAGNGVFAAYPETKGKSENPGAMCYSQPKTTQIISDWIFQLASLPNATGVDQWLTENLQGKKGCQCDLCLKTGVDSMVLEARAVVNACKIAEKRLGRKIDLRLLTSEETEKVNAQIFSELPPGMKVIYYHSLFTYTSGSEPMLRPYLKKFTESGGWLGVCPSIASYPRFVEPFNSPQFIRARQIEFVDKGLQCLLGYSTPRVHFNAYNVEASAEWSWNAKGRSAREFAQSYAVRQGFKDPEKFAEYSLAVGQVEWDVYGSDWPRRADNWIGEPFEKQLRTGTLPELGYALWETYRAPFAEFKTKQQLDGDVALAQKAVKLADEMGIEQLRQESRVVRGYVRSIKALYEIKLLTPGGKVAHEKRAEATKWFQECVDGLREAATALPKWEATVNRKTDPPDLTEKAVRVVNENLLTPVKTFGTDLGLKIN